MQDNEASVTDLNSGLMWHLRWTIPVHVLLPLGLWWLMNIDPRLAAQAFVGMHALFLLALLATMRWWWAHSGDLIAVLFVNHIVSFAVTAFLPW